MKITPSEPDAQAGYTETLTAVAVYHPEGCRDVELPWAHTGAADVDLPGDVYIWRDGLASYEKGDVHYATYLVPEAEYRELQELGIAGPVELDTFDFLATPGDVDKVRAASRGQSADDAEGAAPDAGG